MAEFVSDLVESDMHPRRIQPYGGAKKESLESSSLNCRVSYNLYIGSMMTREVCFSSRRVEDEGDVCSHSIGENVEYGSESEYQRC